MTTEAVWAELRARLRSYFRRHVADEHLAEDLLQETFVRVHRSLPELDEEERIAAWVFRVAKNLLVDQRRAAAAAVSELPEEVVASVGGEPNLNAEVESWLRGMIGLLPESSRRAVELAELEGLPQAEVARRLGLSVSGAKSRVQRGRRRLRALLNRCCELDFDRHGNVVDYERRRPTLPGERSRGDDPCGADPCGDSC